MGEDLVFAIILWVASGAIAWAMILIDRPWLYDMSPRMAWWMLVLHLYCGPAVLIAATCVIARDRLKSS